MTYLFIFIIFFIGAIFGSFLNVLVDRGQKGRSLLGRSKCDYCGYKLRWYDNIPIISFFAIGGRCRQCHQKLSWQYPLVEAGLGVFFVAMADKAGLINAALSASPRDPLINSVFYFTLAFLFLAIFVWDVKYMIIPDYLVAIGVGMSIVYMFYRYLGASCSIFSVNCFFSSNLIGGLLVGGFFYLLFHFSNGRWIGGGDVKLGFWLGFLVSWQQVYFFLMISYLFGSLVAIGLLVGGRKKMKSQIPFGPFLLASALVILYWGDQILWWWKGLTY